MSDTVPQPMRILKPSPAATTPASGAVENVKSEAPTAETDAASALEGLSLKSAEELPKTDGAIAQEKTVGSAPEKSDEVLELAPSTSLQPLN